MINTVLFDLDGVLIDSEYRTLMIKKSMLDEANLPYGDDIFTILAGTALALLFRDLYPDYPDADHFLDDYHHRAYDNLSYRNMGMKHADELLHYLKNNGYKLALVTASDQPKIKQVLSELNWEGMFDAIVAGDEGFPRKPDPTVYCVGMQRLNSKPDECVIIEDSNTGLLAAKGSKAIVICRKENRYPVKQDNADYYINDLLEVIDILNSEK